MDYGHKAPTTYLRKLWEGASPGVFTGQRRQRYC